MKKIFRFLLCVFACVFALAIAGCSTGGRYVTGIDYYGADGSYTVYTVTYSDGTTDELRVKNGEDGANGTDGEDGATAYEIYLQYVELYGEISYEEFLEKYLSVNADNSLSVARCLQSAVKVYTEFIERTLTYNPRPTYTTDVAVYTGGGIIWRIDEDYTYMVTNYHVVYDASAVTESNGGSNLARSIYCYLYGSEYSPERTSEKDGEGYSVIGYGEYGIECEYVGGAASADLAVFRARTEDMLAVNPGIRAVDIAESYHVGETAFTIGNPEGSGLSVTQGVVCVDNEYIALSVDGTERYYRSLRIDVPLYEGNSGGGLFNCNGELIGVSNAGDSTNQNINYAIPVGIVEGIADNIIYYATDGDETTDGAYRVTVGITTSSENSKYVYDIQTGYGEICEDIIISSVTANSIAEGLGLQTGDALTAVVINGTVYGVTRYFYVGDILFKVRAGDNIAVKYLRGGEAFTSAHYTVQSGDLLKVE